MKKFIVEDSFWDIFPKAKLGIIVAKGIDNQIKEENQYIPLIQECEKAALQYLTHSEFSQNPVVKVWREAYQEFKTKKGARSSIEAMLKRVNKGNHLNSINPLVDLYNAMSLKYALPCGGEDMDTFVGNMRLTKAEGTEEFITYGSDKSEPPYENEVIYKDDAGAICRCWNWRESVRTMLVEETTNAFLCIETLDEERDDVFKMALQDLNSLILENLGGESVVHILDINHREVIIED